MPPAGHEAQIDASCTAPFCGEQAAARCVGSHRAGVCAVGGRGLAAPSCISVTRFRAAGRGTVLWSVCCAAPSCCVRHGDEVDNQSLCYPLTEQADEASPPVESYVFGVSLQCHSSGLSNHIHTFHTVNSFYWAVSKGLADINESYQHSRGV